MPRWLYLVLPVCFPILSQAQSSVTCVVSAGPPVVRMEGITERTGDLVLACSGGGAGARITGNLTLFLNTNITNRVASNTSNTVTDVAFAIDNGSGPQPAAVQGVITGPSILVFNGLSFMLSPSGTATLRIANVRGAASQLGAAFPSNAIAAQLAFNSNTLSIVPTNQFTVAQIERGLFAGYSSKIVCSQQGSPLPTNTASLASFLGSGSVFASTRLTEGFADAFNRRSEFQSLNADSGTRIIVNYGGFPAGARLLIPNVIAGSDAIQPTAGGDFGLAPSGGQYAPGGSGSLLLALVQGASPSGAGGSPVYFPGPVGSPAVSFDAMAEVPLANGSGFAVYEVVDDNPNVQESVQFPTFLGLPAFTGAAVQTTETVSFAPVSTVVTATASDPIPRFVQTTVPDDCTIVGDCGASYFPRLNVPETSLSYSAPAGTGFQVAYVRVQNSSGGVMQWSASVTYQNGSGWLRLDPTSGTNNSTVRVDALPGTLAPGVYNATLTIDAGPVAGTRSLPVSFTITAPPPPTAPPPVVTSVVNAATFGAVPLVPGSLATLQGSKFSGTGLSVTFDGSPAQVLFSNDTQINLLVPTALASKNSAQLIVSVNGISSTGQTIALAPFAPGIFQPGVLNQDYSLNSSSQPARLGSVIQIFATGLSGAGVISANIGGEAVAQPYYAGPAPGLTGVQQVDLIVPLDLSGPSANVTVCGGVTSAQPVCSPPVAVAIAPSL